MQSISAKDEIIRRLQKEVLSLQGFKKLQTGVALKTGLGIIEKAFPNQVFPTGAVHEFISLNQADAAATSGFMIGLLAQFIQHNKICIWVSTRRSLFPAALPLFGINPERIVFIDADRPKQALWVIEEALKCGALAAVVGEIAELNFTESRRLQLAVEKSRVTGFIHRYTPGAENTVACVTRWKIKCIVGGFEEDLPGVGYARWDVQLLKVRNGKPGSWQFEKRPDGFHLVTGKTIPLPGTQKIKAG